MDIYDLLNNKFYLIEKSKAMEQPIWKAHEFDTAADFAGYVYGTFVNGQLKQLLQLFWSMNLAERQEVLESINHMNLTASEELEFYRFVLKTL